MDERRLAVAAGANARVVSKTLPLIHNELTFTMAFCGHCQLKGVDESILPPGTFSR